MSDKEFGLESVRVMQAANALLSMNKKRQRLVQCIGTLERGYQYRSATGKLIVVPVNRSFGLWTGIRSILQRIDEKRACNWLINGQADQNMQELVFVGAPGAIIQYDRADALQMQYELALNWGNPRPISAAEASLERLLSNPQVGPLAPQSQLIMRDSHDQPYELHLSRDDMQFVSAAA